MRELVAWIDRQARREASVVRLEDALLANRFAQYFFYRLRFLVARSAISTVIHAAKVVLLLGVFPRSEFLLVVILQGSVALATDFWWGALEQMRADIRTLQRRQARHVIPREISRWLTLSTRLAVGVGSVAIFYAVSRALGGGLGAVDALAAALLLGAALNLVARTYHSGAYALRRVYRPLPSLLALDFVSVGVLLALWPFVGIWAFPIAELLSILVVVAIEIAYTSRTYRTLAMPTLRPLVAMRMPIPRLRSVRGSIGPGLSYALVGLEALVVIAGIASATTAAGASLVVLLAALAPVTRASFEWARLLYFDLKRMDVPLLADLRRRFDRAVIRLALVIGLTTGLLAAAVAAFIVEPLTPLLIVALLLLFIVRSILAAAQMQAFTRTAYTRLAAAGLVGVAGVAASFFLPAPADWRMLGVCAALGVSLALLVSLPQGRPPDEGVVAPPEWLRRLRLATGPITVTKLHFDDRLDTRGTTAEKRRAEEWRRRNVAFRLGASLHRRGGAAAWISPTMLWAFEPTAAGRSRDAGHLVRGAAGLVDAAPEQTEWLDSRTAALELVEVVLVISGDTRVTGDAGAPLPSVGLLVADFERRFPSGIAYDTAKAPPDPLTTMSSRQRAEIYRAALLVARGVRRGRGPNDREVTALVANGSLRAIFAIDRTESAPARRAWRDAVNAWTIRAAAGAPLTGALPTERDAAKEGDASATEVAML